MREHVPANVLEPLSVAESRSLLASLLQQACRWAEKAGLLRLTLSAEELIASAERQTGLQDFGGEEFRELLGKLLTACQQEAGLNALGRLAAGHDVHQLLVNRLQLVDARKVDPAIAQRRIIAPLFITGLPRTGTTLLHNLLAQDPANRTPLTWETMYPSAAPVRGIRKAQKDIRWLHLLAPAFRAIHDVDAEFPQECVALMSHAFMSDQFDIMYRVPSYVAWLEEQDLRPAYEWHRRFLQHLPIRQANRWVLKAPAHLQSLGALLACYPDARVVQTHREPIEVLASVASLTALLRSVFSDSVDRAEIGRELAIYWAGVLDRFQVARAQAPAEQFLDLTFTELTTDPIAAVRQVYEWLECRLTPEAEAQMRRFLAAHPRRQHGTHRYSLGQFGLDPGREHARFSRYRDRFALGASR